MSDTARLVRLRPYDCRQPLSTRLMRYEKQFVSVHGKQMAYIDTGGPGGTHEPDTAVFLHGNITQSYMWRNIIPHIAPLARCIAVDNIGQGDSDKLNDSGPGSYRLQEHQHYIDGFLDALTYPKGPSPS